MSAIRVSSQIARFPDVAREPGARPPRPPRVLTGEYDLTVTAARSAEAPASESLATPPVAASRKRHRLAGWLGTVLAVVGVLLIAYAVVVLLFGDPLTGLYQRWQQHQLAGQLDTSFRQFELLPKAETVKPFRYRHNALLFARQVKSGQPIGRIQIPSIHVSQIVVNGTSWLNDLSRGPGRYPQTSFPGLGKVTAIAGHRTTFGAPFRHIDEIKSGDLIVMRMPYATFLYRVYGHKVVRSDDWSIIRPHGFDELVLSACHPLYSASHRWIVFARLRSVKPPQA
jgi:sortase A